MHLLIVSEEILFNHKDLIQIFTLTKSNHTKSVSYPPSICSSHGMFIYYLFSYYFIIVISGLFVFLLESNLYKGLKFDDIFIQKLESTFSSQKHNDMIFQSASNPWEENQV